jgi:type II secretory pathway component PulF
MRRMMQEWQFALLGGIPVAQAAARAGFPRAFVGFMQSAGGEPGSNAHTLAAVFEFLGRYYRDRFSRLAIFLTALVQPAITLALGLVVLYITLALFLPLVKLIQSVSGGEGSL